MRVRSSVLTGVRAHVDLQGAITAEDFVTEATLVLEERVIAGVLGSLQNCGNTHTHTRDQD